MHIITYDQVISKVIDIRRQKAIIDSDVAELYDVETKRINEAVKNNLDKFPKGYLIELTSDEWTPLKSKFSTSIKGGKTKLPTAFTEKGLYMLATILKSPKAVQTTIAIIEAFAQLKELTQKVYQLANAKTEAQQIATLEQGIDLFTDLLDNELVISQQETEVKIKLPFLEFTRKITKVKK
ncbi:MAG: ORF6N domain-containing protein [Burkholderiales bacterium]|nr:ORF6N domain-containing protein [Burkholderiales bacterium]